jgi:hypothetical protein
MIFRNLDSTGDWVLGYGKSSYVRDEAAIETNIKTRLASWVGNCPWDLTAGVDWINRLDANQAAQLQLDLSNVIAQSDGVVNVTFVEGVLDGKTRNFVVRYNVDTVYSRSFSREVDILLGAQGN